MKRLRRVAVTGLAAAWAAAAAAKPWNGVNPGSSTKADVLKRFGEPTKKVTQDGKEVLAYIGEQAIKGTTQTQFTVGTGGLVEQITVFPATAIDKPTVEESFGPACAAPGTAGPSPATSTCYVKKLTDDFRTYFWYKRAGFVVFFTEDGKSVYSLLYNAPASGEK